MRRAFIDAYNTALEAAEPAAAVRRVLRSRERRVELDGESIDVTGSIRVAALGKAAPAMARGVMDVLGDRVVDGVVVTDRIEEVPTPLQLLRGEHPYPGPGSVEAGGALLDQAGRCEAGDLLLVLVSGGASALAELPTNGTSIEELAEVQRSLVATGTPIEELNCVRRHLSQLKNGGLLRAAGDAAVVSLLISDVVDAAPNAIGSGPTLADGSTTADARQVLEQRVSGAAAAMFAPDAAASHAGEHHWRVIADGSVAAAAARHQLVAEGFDARVLTTRLNGEAHLEGARLIATVPPGMSVLTGETTVTGATSGRGGRNLEAALAAAIAIEDRGRWVFAALDTDGIDGATNAAGAIVDSGTLARGRAHGFDPRSFLRRHDSYPFLEATGDLVITGPSGTNVGDLWLVHNGS